MQPTYLPWSGYFNLLASVDDFVFLDDVQFERRSWQSRNRILLGGREHMLTVPVVKAPREVLINAVEVDDTSGWRGQHSKVLSAAYGHAPYGALALAAVLPCIADTTLRRLADLNIQIVTALCSLLGISARLHRASNLDCGGRRSEHLALLCDRVDADEYIAPAGSAGYLEEDGFEARYGKRLHIQQFTPPPYPQRRAATFVSHLSLLDVMAHLGPEHSISYVRGTYL